MQEFMLPNIWQREENIHLTSHVDVKGCVQSNMTISEQMNLSLTYKSDRCLDGRVA